MGKWRAYEKKDSLQISALHVQMQHRTGEHFDLPDLSKRPILIAMVYEENGVITHAAVLEAQAEFMALGETALPAKVWDEADTILTQVCCAYRIGMVRAFVPVAMLAAKNDKKLSPLARLLGRFGFQREDETRVRAFTRWMGGKG